MACRLTYFNFRALGEPIRMLLSYGNINFEDVRIDRHGQEWIDKKNSFPMSQLPLLEMDGLKMHQSKSICRYLGDKAKLNGETGAEKWEIDAAADVVYDLIMKMRTLREIDDPDAKEKKYLEFEKTFVPHFLGNLDKMANLNRGYLACRRLTWADFFFTGMIEYLEFLTRTKIPDNYENLKKVVENVHALPQLKNHMSTRPKVDY